MGRIKVTKTHITTLLVQKDIGRWSVAEFK